MLKSRAQKAVDYYVKYGYNCSQAIAVTYADLPGLDPETCFRGMEALGRGMGGRLGTCGAITGAVYLAGFVTSTCNMDEDRKNKSKEVSYALSKKITQEFYDKNGTVTCGDLKDSKGPHFRPCPLCIADAAILVEKHIFPGQFEEPAYFDEKN